MIARKASLNETSPIASPVECARNIAQLLSIRFPTPRAAWRSGQWRFSPVGTPRPAYNLDNQSVWPNRTSALFFHPSWTSAPSLRGAPGLPPQFGQRRLQRHSISKLNCTALILTVYAWCRPRERLRKMRFGWLAFSGWGCITHWVLRSSFHLRLPCASDFPGATKISDIETNCG